MFNPDINASAVQTLADIMGGGTAAAYAGGQAMMQREMNNINKDISLADLSRLNIENAHNQVMNPLLQDVQRSKSREANLQDNDYWTQILQGKRADARKAVNEADVLDATKEGRIGATNSDNTHKVITNMGANMRQIAQYVATLPEAEQGDAIRAIVADHGWNKHPGMNQAWERLAQLSGPERLAQLQAAADRLATMDSQYIREIQKQSMHDATSRYTADRHYDAAALQAASRRKDTEFEFKKMWNSATDEKRAGILDALVAEARTMGQSVIELPSGAKLPIQDAEKLAKHYTQRMLSRVPAQVQVPGIDRTNPAASGAGALYPGGLGSNPRDPLGIR